MIFRKVSDKFCNLDQTSFALSKKKDQEVTNTSVGFLQNIALDRLQSNTIKNAPEKTDTINAESEEIVK